MSILKSVSLLLQLFLSIALLFLLTRYSIFFENVLICIEPSVVFSHLARDGCIRRIIISEIKLTLNDPAVFAVKAN